MKYCGVFRLLAGLAIIAVHITASYLPRDLNLPSNSSAALPGAVKSKYIDDSLSIKIQEYAPVLYCGDLLHVILRVMTSIVETQASGTAYTGSSLSIPAIMGHMGISINIHTEKDGRTVVTRNQALMGLYATAISMSTSTECSAAGVMVSWKKTLTQSKIFTLLISTFNSEGSNDTPTLSPESRHNLPDNTESDHTNAGILLSTNETDAIISKSAAPISRRTPVGSGNATLAADPNSRYAVSFTPNGQAVSLETTFLLLMETTMQCAAQDSDSHAKYMLVSSMLNLNSIMTLEPVTTSEVSPIFRDIAAMLGDVGESALRSDLSEEFTYTVKQNRMLYAKGDIHNYRRP